MTWYYLQDGQTLGPVSEEDLQNLLQAGTLPPNVQVWREGMPEWRSHDALYAASIAPPAGLRVAEREAPPLLNSPTEQVLSETPAVAPPIGHRIAAKLIDVAYLGACIAVVMVFFQYVMGVVERVGGPARFNKSIAKPIMTMGATALGLGIGIFRRKWAQSVRRDPVKRSIGKRIMKLAVVDQRGQPLGRPARFSRALIQLLMVGGMFFITLAPLLLIANRPRPRQPMRGSITYRSTPAGPAFESRSDRVNSFLFSFMIALVFSQTGYAIALLRPDRRGLHDLICGTRVVTTE